LSQLEQQEEQQKLQAQRIDGVAPKHKARNNKDNSSLVSLTVAFVVFVALPYEMYILGAPILSIFAVVIFTAGLLADIFTTKAGFNRGYGDYNVFYNMAKKKKVRNNSFLVASFIFGAIRAFIMFYYWNDTLILMIVASMSLIGPLWNSIILAYPEANNDVKDSPVPSTPSSPPASDVSI
jgi:Mn2+/Fe2+ NRAMP family transporter